MEFAACLLFIGLMFLCSPIENIKTGAAIFWLVVLFIGFITSPTDRQDVNPKESAKCPNNTKV